MTAQYKTKRRQAGDTIIEVMLATVIMSIVVMAAFALVNRASRINQVSSERSEATNAMQFQAEALRQSRDSEDQEVWRLITGGGEGTFLSDGTGGSSNCFSFINDSEDPSPVRGDAWPYYFDDGLTLQNLSLSSGSGNVGRYYVWIEGYRGGTDYQDFFIHSCWEGPGGTGPQQASLFYRLGI